MLERAFLFCVPQMRQIITSFLLEYPAALINSTIFSMVSDWNCSSRYNTSHEESHNETQCNTTAKHTQGSQAKRQLWLFGSRVNAEDAHQ